MRGTVWLDVQCHFISLPSGQLMPHIGLPLPTHLTNFNFSLFHPTYCKKAHKTRGYSSPFWDAPNLSTRKSIASLNGICFRPTAPLWPSVHQLDSLCSCHLPSDAQCSGSVFVTHWKMVGWSLSHPALGEKLLKIIRHNLRSANRWSLSEGLEPPQLYIRKMP
jgi:hypothetical protein